MARYMARSSSALYSAYVCTYHVHIDSVLAAFFPRKSQSKPQTDTPYSSSERISQMQTNYKCATSFMFLLALPEIFFHRVPKVLPLVSIQVLTTTANAEVMELHRFIRWGWQEQGARAGFTPSISTSQQLPFLHLARHPLSLPPTFILALHTSWRTSNEMPLSGNTPGANSFIQAGKPVTLYLKELPVLQYIN